LKCFLKLKYFFFSNPRRVILYAHKNNENNKKKDISFPLSGQFVALQLEEIYSDKSYGLRMEKEIKKKDIFLIVFFSARLPFPNPNHCLRLYEMRRTNYREWQFACRYIFQPVSG